MVYHLHEDTSNVNGYSDSCTNYKEYVKLAKKQGMKALAFSNHGGIYDWIKKKQECDKAKIKYIHGVELYLCTDLKNDERGFHIGLYARNWEGVKELNKLISISTSKGVKEDKSDRHMYYNPRISMEELMDTSSNIIITTACLASLLWRMTEMSENILKDESIDIKERDLKSKEFLNHRDIFLNWLAKNNDRCFLEIQYHNCKSQKEYNLLLLEWSKRYNIPLIAGTDTHSSTKYKAECRKILQKSKDSFYGEEDEFDLTWKSYDDLVQAFKIQGVLSEEVYLNAIENTNKFADMFEDFVLDKKFKYPNLYGENALKLFKDRIIKKYEEKVKNNIIDKKNTQYLKNIKEEFATFKQQGMESFMLFMSELVEHCNNNDIPFGFCRGSVGGSTIAYIIDIIDVDPVIWGTVFSRFCNISRISLGDIDMDFAPKDRPKVYEWIISRFGTQNTAYIAQFGTLKDRGTIDVLAKGLDDYGDLEKVAIIKDEFEKIFSQYSEIIQSEVNIEELDLESSSIDFDNHNIYIERIRNNKALIKANKLHQEFQNLKQNNSDLFYYFDGLKGTIMSKGSHPSGIIGSPITLQDNLGVFYKDGDDNLPVSQCAMKAVDSLNYVKFDILGLKTVGIMKDTYKYINSHYLKSHEIDWEDENVWNDMIKSQIGVFQFEGDYAFSLLKDFKPHKINDMSLVNASLRPSGKSYRDRLIAREFNKNPSKEIDNLLKQNNGFLVYQEDTIKFLTDICGFDGSLADTTRRAIGKKDIELLNAQLPKILEGYCKVSKQPREVAEAEAKEFLQIIEDSSEYQFGYNHSTGYSMNGYACTRLRHYYPLEFTTAYLNNASNKEDIQMGTILAKEKNIKIKPIEFGQSIDVYTFDKKTNTIYKGIESIKFCNAKIAYELYALRDNNYNSFAELLSDIITKTSTDSRQLKILTGLGFFKKFGKNKKLLAYIEIFDKFNGKKQIKKSDLQKLGLKEELIKKYSKRETEALYKELDIIGLITELTNSLENKPLSVKEQVKFEKDFLEYVIYTNSEVSSKFYIVTEFTTYNDKRKPYVTLHQIKTGDDIKTKIKEPQIFVENPFELYSVLKVIEFKTQKKTKCVNGKWQKTDEDEDILYKYEVY